VPLVEITDRVRKHRGPVQRSATAEARRKARTKVRRKMAAKSRKANRS
jgi:hypothetical protein